MIFNLNEQKVLSDPSGSSVFKGEKDFNNIVVNLPDNIDGHTATELNYVMHFVDSDGGYSTKILTVDSSGEALKATATVSTSITSKAQAFYAYVLMTDDEETVIGKTNGVIVMIHPVPDEENEIIPPADADKIIKGLEEIVKEATDTIEEATEAIGSKQDKLTAGENITIDEDNVISAEGGGVTSYNDLTDKPQINGTTLLSGNQSSDSLGLQKKLYLNTNDLLSLDGDGNLYLYNTRILRSSQRSNITDLNKLYGNTMIYIGHPTNVAHVPSEVSPGSIGLVIPIDFTVPNSSQWYTEQIYIECTSYTIPSNIFVRTAHRTGTSYPDSFTPWVKLNGGAQIVSGVVNVNGTITFTDSDGNTFTTTGASVIGPQGDDYVLTAQDKSDIANIVLGELPTTQGVLYGNQSN